MEENLLYLDKEVLDAQQSGKADNFELPHNCITIKYEIGKGAFGRVFKATVQNLNRKPGITTVAVKQLKKKSSHTEIEEFLNEIQTMKNIGHHENIVTLLGCCTIKEPYMMVMEFIGQNDLLQYLRNIRKRYSNFSPSIPNTLKTAENSQNNNSTLPIFQGNYLDLQLSSYKNSDDSKKSYITDNRTSPLRPSVTETMYTMLSQQSSSLSHQSKNNLSMLDHEELHNFAVQIANGMKHLEEKGITHRDLAARNVLIDEFKILKISDFGLSRSGIYVKPKDKIKLLPLRWLSTEAIHDNFYSNKSDVWAYGIVLWEIGTLGGFPYPTLNNQELIQFIFSGKRLEKPDICTDFLYELMLRCWDEDSSKRPSFAEIFECLQSQNIKLYVNLNDIEHDYVFPPIEKESIQS